jgi:hypothetical protein
MGIIIMRIISVCCTHTRIKSYFKVVFFAFFKEYVNNAFEVDVQMESVSETPVLNKVRLFCFDFVGCFCTNFMF